jgi:hypothetical protein
MSGMEVEVKKVVVCFGIFFKCFASAGASSALIPNGFVGYWASSEGSECGVFTVYPNRYMGMADSEGYGCDLIRVTEEGLNGSWQGRFICAGEGGSHVPATTTLTRLTIDKQDTLIVSEQWARSTTTLALRRCQK